MTSAKKAPVVPPARIVLTGSSSGIGRALATRLLGHGHQVWGLARSDQSEMAARHPGRFFSSRCDVGVWDEVERAFREIAAAWRHVDGLVTAAGSQGEVGRALAADPRRWSATVRANLDGTFFTLRAAGELLAGAPRRAKVVCFSGGGATRARARFSAYGVAKAAIVRLVETIAEEQADRPIDINAIAPGAIPTRMTRDVIALGPEKAGTEEYEAARRLVQEGGDALDRALDLVEWLLSPASDRISGRLISARWDPWRSLDHRAAELAPTDIYRLRRIVPGDRGQHWE